MQFRLWAPRLRGVQVAIADCTERVLEMSSQEDGEFAVFAEGLPAGADYLFLTDDGRKLPDPVSRWQPAGVHGPSRVVDPATFPGRIRIGAASRSRNTSSTNCTRAHSLPRVPLRA